MYCDCCDKRLHNYPKDTKYPLCSSCEAGDCYDTGHS